jgi:hypothetical protein
MGTTGFQSQHLRLLISRPQTPGEGAREGRREGGGVELLEEVFGEAKVALTSGTVQPGSLESFYFKGREAAVIIFSSRKR